MNITVTATSRHQHPEQPSGFTAAIDFPTEAEALAFAASMPKALAAKAGRVVSYARLDADGKPSVFWSVTVSANLLARAGNAVNETGVKRYAGLVRWAAETGTALVWDDQQARRVTNAYPTREAFEAAIA